LRFTVGAELQLWHK